MIVDPTPDTHFDPLADDIFKKVGGGPGDGRLLFAVDLWFGALRVHGGGRWVSGCRVAPTPASNPRQGGQDVADVVYPFRVISLRPPSHNKRRLINSGSHDHHMIHLLPSTSNVHLEHP